MLMQQRRYDDAHALSCADVYTCKQLFLDMRAGMAFNCDLYKAVAIETRLDTIISSDDFVQEKKEEVEAESLQTLSDDERAPLGSTTFRSDRNKHFPSGYYILAAVSYLILAVLYIKLWIRNKELEARAIEPDLFPAVAQSSVFRKDSRVFPLTVAGTPFTGDPSPELDQAWHDLLQGTTIRVSKEDLGYYNVTSLPLADGSGFASELFMTHELHCLKKVRQYIYKDTYFEDVQGFERNELKRHIDHCIETLRQGIICRGDVSLGTYTYIQGSNDVTARSWGSHQCIDFEALISWTRQRAIDIFQAGVLAKPEDLGSEHFTEKKPPH